MDYEKDPNFKFDETRKYGNELCVTSQHFFCGIPLKVDSYNGCYHNCAYCFANYSLGRVIALQRQAKKAGESQATQDEKFAANDFNITAASKVTLKNRFDRILKKMEVLSVADEFIRAGIPVHFGGMSDPFQPAETKSGITLEFLKLFQEYDYPCVLSTKGTNIITPEHTALMERKKFVLQVSFITLNNKLLKGLDPQAPSVEERLGFIRKHSSKIQTIIRIQPFIPDIFEDDAVLDEFFKTMSEAGVQVATLEHLKLQSVRNDVPTKIIMEATGKDIKQGFRDTYSQISAKDMEYPAGTKYKNFVRVKQAANKYGVKIGAADNELHHLGDTVVCCGTDHFNLPYYKFQITQGAVEAIKENRVLKFSDLSKHDFSLKLFEPPFGSSVNGERISETLRFWLKRSWNSADLNSPARLIGFKAIGQDEQGNAIYEFKQSNLQAEVDKAVTNGTLF